MEALVNSIPGILSIASGLLAVLLLSLEAGFRRGSRAVRVHDVAPSAQVGAVQGAILGMLGLLLAFSFAAAASRFLERQDLIVQEANAIGTAYLRAELIDEPARSDLRQVLAEYTRHRIEAGAQFRRDPSGSEAAKIERMHDRIWGSAVSGVRARPELTVAVLNPVNDVIDLHSTRVFAAQKHLPALVLMLLIASAMLALGVIGYGCGVGERRSAAMTVPLAIVIALALWITIDLDYPRAGFLQLSDAPLKALRFDAPAP
jgi:hypothetical protein